MFFLHAHIWMRYMQMHSQIYKFHPPKKARAEKQGDQWEWRNLLIPGTVTCLHASRPSVQVCSFSGPHFSNHVPPEAQQLLWPEFASVPHTGHEVAVAVAVVVLWLSCECRRSHVAVQKVSTIKNTKKTTTHQQPILLPTCCFSGFCTSLGTLRPSVCSIRVADVAARPDPCTARSATAALVVGRVRSAYRAHGSGFCYLCVTKYCLITKGKHNNDIKWKQREQTWQKCPSLLQGDWESM